MKFRFPVVIIDEDFRSENASGLGIRALAKAIEEENFEQAAILRDEIKQATSHTADQPST